MALVDNGQDFLESVGFKMDTARGLTTGGNEDKRRHQRVMEKWAGVKKVGYEIVTVVSCLPFPIEIRSTVGYFEIRACKYKQGEFFFAYQIDRPKMSICDEGEAKFTPEVIYPVEIGMEFENTYSETGGVFMLRGAKDLLDNTLLMERVAAAQGAMLAWMTAQYELGEDTHARFKGQPRRISDNMRNAAVFLRDQGMIDNLPEWVHINRATSGTKPCKHCGETIKQVATVCRFCMLRQDTGLDQQLPSGSAPRPSVRSDEPQPESLSPAIPATEDDEDELSDSQILGAKDEDLRDANRGTVTRKKK
jgi:hypothetical protein